MIEIPLPPYPYFQTTQLAAIEEGLLSPSRPLIGKEHPPQPYQTRSHGRNWELQGATISPYLGGSHSFASFEDLATLTKEAVTLHLA